VNELLNPLQLTCLTVTVLKFNHKLGRESTVGVYGNPFNSF
jgi:hypothetical protein